MDSCILAESVFRLVYYYLRVGETDTLFVECRIKHFVEINRDIPEIAAFDPCAHGNVYTTVGELSQCYGICGSFQYAAVSFSKSNAH